MNVDVIRIRILDDRFNQVTIYRSTTAGGAACGCSQRHYNRSGLTHRSNVDMGSGGRINV
jgi:hypothetical protein